MKHLFYAGREDAGLSLHVFLRRRGASVALIKKVKFLPDGILVNGEKQNTDYRIRENDLVILNDTDREMKSTVIPVDGELEILYEDPGCIVVNKPRNMPCHPSFNHPDDSLANLFRGRERRLGTDRICRIVNRLDRNTTGLVLIRLDSFSAERLKGKVDKKYTALAEGVMEPREGIIDLPIARTGDSIITRCVSDSGERRITEYRTLKSNGEVSLLEIRLHTGRTHQIRVHFSHLGHPLLGDDLYGGNTDRIERHALHCSALTFPDRDGNAVTVESPLPDDMKAIADSLGG
ncbi:MAG: RluA family pseudouridine synthase [Oscillospiraceae bacterium]|nr:RluA family pseudouridine synthase [Oscillospiraceae bacterium]